MSTLRLVVQPPAVRRRSCPTGALGNGASARPLGVAAGTESEHTRHGLPSKNLQQNPTAYGSALSPTNSPWLSDASCTSERKKWYDALSR
jgi:hypothetical protein